MASELAVSVLTPTQSVVQAAVDAVTAPSVMGQITILPMHAPLLANLGPGILFLRAASRQDRYFITGGSLEVERDRVVILANGAELADNIDAAAARKELEACESALQNLDATHATYAESWSKLERARARVNAAGSQG